MANDPQVRCLQEFLKNQGVAIYPEAKITGNFFDATKAAVIKFQEKYAGQILVPSGLAKANGVVGPNTKKIINGMISADQK
jgi:tryptophanase